jgi:ATP-binding cassette subfamily C (CFTR/MRP) protein 1
VFFTFAAFAAVADIKGSNSISTSVVITSLSILNLLGDPLSQLLFSIPQAYAALACFQRIQEFLLTESRAERRVFNSNSMSVTRIVAVSNGSQSSQIELADLNIQNSSAHILPAEKIVVEGGTFGWSEERPPVIEDICMHINHKSMFTVIIGPVGCGKSTFLKGLLGETSAFKGMVLLDDSEVAFCDQTPWITNASIRENIVGESMFDATWYDEVVGACALVSLRLKIL